MFISYLFSVWIHPVDMNIAGVQQSRGWAHYEWHRPEPHILLFRRPLGTDPRTGKVIKPAK